MAVIVTIRDENVTGGVYHQLPLKFPTERATVRELIRERVYQEVQDFNRKNQELVFRGLVQPTNAEQFQNARQTGYRLKEHRHLEWEPQFEKALEAFVNNVFFILVDDQQAERLDEEFVISNTSAISFVKLTSLVGG